MGTHVGCTQDYAMITRTPDESPVLSDDNLDFGVGWGSSRSAYLRYTAEVLPPPFLPALCSPLLPILTCPLGIGWMSLPRRTLLLPPIWLALLDSGP